MRKFGLFVVLIFCLVSLVSPCDAQVRSFRIFVRVYTDYLMFENKLIRNDEFESRLKLEIEQRMKAGVKREDLIISMNVDPETKRGKIADLEVVMRRLNLRKIEYSTMGKKQT